MIILDMDMPKNCQECLRDNGFSTCPFDCMECVDTRNPICPIKCNIEDIKAEMEDFKERINQIPNMAVAYAAVVHCLDIIDKHTKGDTDADSN